MSVSACFDKERGVYVWHCDCEECITLGALRIKHDEMFERMQTPEARIAMQRAFEASPEELGRAAVRAVTMNPTLKTILKVAAIVLVPGAAIYFVTKAIIDLSNKKEFRDYIRKTYGGKDEVNVEL